VQDFDGVAIKDGDDRPRKACERGEGEKQQDQACQK